MKNKVLIILLILLIIILAIIISIKFKKSNSTTNKETSRNFILQTNTVSNVNTNGENTGIYVGVTENGNENYLFVSVNIQKKASEEEQICSLISAISDSTGYKIDVNSVEKNGNNIKINLAQTAAPFELKESYQNTDSIKYFIPSDYAVAKTLFDSINKTLKSYFGNDIKLYLSADSQDIHIVNEVLKIDIDSTKPYDEQ